MDLDSDLHSGRSAPRLRRPPLLYQILRYFPHRRSLIWRRPNLNKYGMTFWRHSASGSLVLLLVDSLLMLAGRISRCYSTTIDEHKLSQECSDISYFLGNSGIWLPLTFGGYSKRTVLLPLMRKISPRKNLEMIEDGAPSHTSKYTGAYRPQHGIHRLLWPASLNLIDTRW